MHPGSCLKTCPQTSSDETREVLALRLGEWRQGLEENPGDRPCWGTNPSACTGDVHV